MRNRFSKQLDTLNLELTKMGALCEVAISSAIKALLDNDSSMAQKANRTDSQIDRMERDIEALCMKLLLQQQPVASDLRLISSALKMISDMERIGDQASDIAEIVEHINDHDLIEKIHIKEMALASIKMVTDSVESFVTKDLDMAVAVIAYDDVVDSLFEKIKGELVAVIVQDSNLGQAAIDLLMIAKYLERIGDHAENIAEWVEFSIIGQHRNSYDEQV